MMTVAEAMQRLAINKATMRRVGREWLVTLNEWTKAQCDELGYLTDDLLDAVLQAGSLRRAAA